MNTTSVLPAAVLFDLDGTLLDTAPDMVHALNVVCRERQVPEVPFPRARAYVSNGAVGLLRLAFPEFDPATDKALHQLYLGRYAECLAVDTRLFEPLDVLLGCLESRAVPWGIVTNKPGYLTGPLLAALGLHHRSACTVSGDTLPERKPHPRPVQYALECLGVAGTPARTVYVGDARRDIQSGRGAGTRTVAVRYGYVEPGEDPDTWGADHLVGTPAELIDLLLEGLNP